MPFKTQVTETRDELIGYLERASVQSKDRIVNQFPWIKDIHPFYELGANRTLAHTLIASQ